MAGYKLWGFDELLGSNDLNDLLMSQVIPRFDSVGERSSAITSPQPNQYAYVNEVGLTRWNGSGWVVEIAANPSVTPSVINFTSFYSTWTNYGGGFESARYYKDFSGVVHLEGLVKAGTSSDLNEYAVLLPAGFRPAATQIFPVLVRQGGTDNKIGRVDIGSTGQVIVRGGGGNFRAATNDWLSLSGIKFMAGA